MERQNRLLLALVAGLLVLVALDRWWEPDDPLDNARATAMAWRVDYTDVRRLEAHGLDGERLIVQRSEDGVWVVEAPFEGPANQNVVSRLVRALTQVERGEPLDVADLAPFGLTEPPQARVTLTLDDGSTRQLDIGHAAPSGWRTYVRGADGIMVVDGELLQGLFLPEEELQDRHLLNYESESVRRITLASEGGTMSLSGEDRDWWVEDFARADLDAVEGLVAGLLDIQAQHWMDGAAPDGIVEPAISVTIEFDDAESVELRVGDGMPMGQLVQVVSGRTAAVPPESLAFLGQGPTDAADRYVFPIRQVRPTGCEVSLGGQSWTTEFGEHGWSRDGSEDRKAFEVMESLRSLEAHYTLDPPGPFTDVWGEVVLIGESEARRVIEVGPLDGDYRLVRDSAGGATYRVLAAGIEALRQPF